MAINVEINEKFYKTIGPSPEVEVFPQPPDGPGGVLVWSGDKDFLDQYSGYPESKPDLVQVGNSADRKQERFLPNTGDEITFDVTVPTGSTNIFPGNLVFKIRIVRTQTLGV